MEIDSNATALAALPIGSTDDTEYRLSDSIRHGSRPRRYE